MSKAKDVLAAPFAISPIIQRFWLPGAVGIPLAAIGAVQEIHWLTWTGIVLALPKKRFR